MPKEERQIDLKTGRVRRKALFDEKEKKEDDDAVSDEEDEQEEAMSEDGSDGDDEEEESDEELFEAEMAPGSAKRLKTEVAQQETVSELPAFADSEDDLEMSSEEDGKTASEENETEEDDDDDDEQRTYGNDSSDSEFEAGSEGIVEYEQNERVNDDKDTRSQLLVRSLKKKSMLTTDSGNCTAEEASGSEVESLSEGDDEEKSRDELEAEVPDRKGFQPKKADRTRQAEPEAEDEEVENLLREEEEYEEETDFSADTAGRL